MVAFSIAILVIAFAVGFYMAWSIGANDVANSMASAVGAKAITQKQAVLIAGILTICGAVFLGAHVSGTISKGIVDPNDIGDARLVMLGALAAILADRFSRKGRSRHKSRRARECRRRGAAGRCLSQRSRRQRSALGNASSQRPL